MNEQPHRPWFRFSLRTMLIVVTVLCCWLGWESSVVRRRQAVLRELQGNAAFQFTSAADWAKRYPPGAPVPEDLANVPLVRRCLGDVAIQEIWFTRHYQGFSEAELSRLTKTFPEAEQREILPEPCHPGCFPRGTLVETTQGPRSIESIQLGDSLTAFLPSGEPVIAAVQSIFITDNRLWKVETAAGGLLTTETQPLCLSTNEIRPAGKLVLGDQILHFHDGEILPVKILSVSPTGRTVKVFNLVLGDSELFVANGFLARSKPPAETADRE